MRQRLAALLLTACGGIAGTIAALAQAPAPGSPAAPPSPDATTAWVQRGTAELVALDKVRAQPTPLQVRVGQSVTFHTLTITVRSCAVRPPDMAPDAAAFVDISDTAPGAPGLRGWMLASAPWLSMLQHPIYDVRVTGCKA